MSGLRRSALLCASAWGWLGWMSGCVGPGGHPTHTEHADSSHGAGQQAGLAGIDFYQQHLGTQWAFHCDMEPSCSTFGKQSISRYGLVPGIWMTADRLMRDHGYARHQYRLVGDGHPYDPVEDHALFDAKTVALEASTSDEEWASSQEARPGDATDLFALAESLAEAGDVRGASVEYRRLLHLFPQSDLTETTRRQLALSLSQLGRHREALDALEPLAGVETDAMRALLLRNAGRPSAGLQQLPRDDAESALLGSLIALEAGDSEAARTWATGAREQTKTSLWPTLEEFDRLPTKSRWGAGLLSAAVPGAGQWYSGHRADGLVALLTNAVLIGATAAAIDRDEDVTAWVVGFVAFGFYTGNIYGAVNGARRTNEGTRREFLQQLHGRMRQDPVRFGLQPLRDGGALSVFLRF